MANSITRNLHRWFSRLMSCSSSPVTVNNKSRNPDSAPTLSSASPTSSAVVFKNYNFLYDPAAADSDSDTHAASNSATFATTTATATATATAPATDSDDFSTHAATDSDSDCELDLSSAIASRRLLPPSSPGRSNAIADPSAVAVGIGVAVPTYSPDPYGDFRRSMEEMAAAMGLRDPRGADGRPRQRERLYELLLCYLSLNRKHAHKYIVRAFADLLVGIAEEAAAEEEEEEEEQLEENSGSGGDG